MGQTDFLGSAEHNQKLSEKRASAVINAIEASGLVQYRMSLVSFIGEENSTDNGDPDGIPTDRVVSIVAHLYPTVEQLEPTPKEPEHVAEPVEQEKPQVSLATELLEKAEVGQSVVFGNLNFFPGRHYLVPKALPQLEELVESLNRNPTIEIEIIGHICCKLDSIDGLDVNTQTYDLSANRAKYIYDQLVLAGISADRLSHKGLAGSRPLVFPELNDDDRAKNRRVEIKVTAK